MVVDKSPAIWLGPAIVERLYLSIQAPVSQMAFSQHGQAIAGLHDDHFGPRRQPGKTVAGARDFLVLLHAGGRRGEPMGHLARVREMAA